MIRLVTFAWGSYTWLIKPCIEALACQWVGPPLKHLTVMTDDVGADMPDSWMFDSIPEMWILNPGWREDNFSNRLMDLLNDVSEPIIFWTTPDAFWLDRINGYVVNGLADYMMERNDVVRITLHHIPALDRHRTMVETNCWNPGTETTLVTCSDPKHCSLVSGLGMGPGLFNRKLLLELLQPGWKLWDVERCGTKKMLDTRPDLTSLAVYPGLEKVDLMHLGEMRDLSPYPQRLVDNVREAMRRNDVG